MTFEKNQHPNFSSIDEAKIITILQSAKNIDTQSLIEIFDELYSVYGPNTIKFIPYINKAKIEKIEAIKILGNLIKIPIIQAIVTNSEDEDDGIEVNWQYCFEESQKELKLCRTQIELLTKEIESLKDRLKLPEISEIMLEKYVDPESIQLVKDSLKSTERKQGPLLDALKTAIDAGDAISAEAFARRIDLNNSSIRGYRPLMYACNNSTPEIIEALIRSGADPNGKEEEDGHTPLIRAITNLCFGEEIVSLLLSHGARPNDANEYRYTPLHVAVNCGRIEIAKELIRAGARIDAKEEGGNTPIDFAKDDETRQVLISERQKYLDSCQ